MSEGEITLSRRERQIMDILHREGSASAQEVLDGLPDPPSYSAVRALLATLERKGHIRHKRQGRKYLFSPVVSAEKARRGAVKRLLDTFFGGRPENLVASLLDEKDQKISEEELKRIREMIDQAPE